MNMLARRLLPRLAGARGCLAALLPLHAAGTKALPPFGAPAVRARAAHSNSAAWQLGRPPPAPPAPPPKRAPDTTTFRALVAANVAVYGLWQVAPRDLMIRNFTLSDASLSPARLHTLLLAPFSHVSMGQLLSSLVSLWAFGQVPCRVFGPRMVALYVAGGAVTSLVHVRWARTSRKQLAPQLGADGAAAALAPPERVALGASGATRALLAFETLTFPLSNLFGTPVPTWWLGALFIAPDVYGACEGTRGHGNVAHTATLCGAAVGAAAHVAWRLRIGRW